MSILNNQIIGGLGDNLNIKPGYENPQGKQGCFGLPADIKIILKREDGVNLNLKDFLKNIQVEFNDKPALRASIEKLITQIQNAPNNKQIEKGMNTLINKLNEFSSKLTQKSIDNIQRGLGKLTNHENKKIEKGKANLINNPDNSKLLLNETHEFQSYIEIPINKSGRNINK